ncbi:MAG TPA: hypothetical protein VF324_04775, partial [Methanobacterium sp.]
MVLLLFGLALFLNVSDVSAAADNQTDIINQTSQVTAQTSQVTAQTSDLTTPTSNVTTQTSQEQDTNSSSSQSSQTGNSQTIQTGNSSEITALQVNSSTTFTLDQLATAATWVKTYVDTNHKLPDYVTIGGIQVNMPSFLKLLTNSVLQINNGSNTPIDYLVFNPAPIPRDSIKNGEMAKAEYLKIAADVKSFMDRTGIAPEFAYSTSIGLYFGYQNMVYTYAKILDSYTNNNKVLPAYVSLKPWSLITNPPVSFTLDQVATAATFMKSYMETNHKLPDYVTIGTYNVSMPSFLELLTTSVLQINN